MKTEQIYEKVTQKIVSALENAGSWQSMVVGNGAVPISIAGHEYQGINYLSLMLETIEKGYKSNVWGTFRALGNQGGYVKKGEKGTMIIFWKLIEVHDKENDEVKEIPFLKYSYVFNADQVNWQDEAGKAKVKELEASRDNRNIQSADEIVYGWADRPEIVNSKVVAIPNYQPRLDKVNMPELSQFETADHYYQALFHELVHSTGHKKRLDRELVVDPENHAYSREELVAELGAAFLSNIANLQDDIENHAAYIQGWKQQLSKNTDWLVWAASRAGKAVNYILEKQKVETEKEVCHV